jgi:hypothetical protein
MGWAPPEVMEGSLREKAARRNSIFVHQKPFYGNARRLQISGRGA